MHLRDLVIVTDASSACGARLEVAASLAAEHNARLTGLYVLPIPEPDQAERSTIVGQFILKCIQQEQDFAREVRCKFDSALKRYGLEGEWRIPGGISSEEAAVHGRYADLVILGQLDPAFRREAMPPLRPEDVALSVGRPVLVVPHSWAPTKIRRRVLVAWNARREAARAVHDALPLLTRAELVTVLVANPENWVIPPHGPEPGADVAKHLARHGVNVEVEVVTSETAGPGEIICTRARDRGADLIVMGAYGHSRMRELVLGGATRCVLREMPVPVLLSH